MASRVFSLSFGKRSLCPHILHKSSRRKGCSPAIYQACLLSRSFGKPYGEAHFLRRLWGLLIAGWAGHRKRLWSVFHKMLPGDKILKLIPTLALQGMVLMIVSDTGFCGQMDSELWALSKIV